MSLFEAPVLKILIVEDNPINQMVLEKNLEIWGYSSCSANNGVAALKALDEQGPFQLVLLDLLMPEMDGFETARRLKQKDSHLPIIAVTASNHPVHKQEALAAGASECVFKPFQSAALRLVIDRHLHPSAN